MAGHAPAYPASSDAHPLNVLVETLARPPLGEQVSGRGDAATARRAHAGTSVARLNQRRVVYRAPIRGWRVSGVSRVKGPGELILTPSKLVLATDRGVVDQVLASLVADLQRGRLLGRRCVRLNTGRREITITCSTARHAGYLLRQLRELAPAC